MFWSLGRCDWSTSILSETSALLSSPLNKIPLMFSTSESCAKRVSISILLPSESSSAPSSNCMMKWLCSALLRVKRGSPSVRTLQASRRKRLLAVGDAWLVRGFSTNSLINLYNSGKAPSFVSRPMSFGVWSLLMTSYKLTFSMRRQASNMYILISSGSECCIVCFKSVSRASKTLPSLSIQNVYRDGWDLSLMTLASSPYIGCCLASLSIFDKIMMMACNGRTPSGLTVSSGRDKTASGENSGKTTGEPEEESLGQIPRFFHSSTVSSAKDQITLRLES